MHLNCKIPNRQAKTYTTCTEKGKTFAQVKEPKNN